MHIQSTALDALAFHGHARPRKHAKYEIYYYVERRAKFTVVRRLIERTRRQRRLAVSPFLFIHTHDANFHTNGRKLVVIRNGNVFSHIIRARAACSYCVALLIDGRIGLHADGAIEPI